MQSSLGVARKSRFIKICGITNLEDATLCADLGVDALGVLLTLPGREAAPGSDRLNERDAAALIAQLPRSILSCLLVHTNEVNEVIRLARDLSPVALQVQAAIAPDELCRIRAATGALVIKKFAVSSDSELDTILLDIRSYLDTGSIDAVLLDSPRAGRGIAHNWELSAGVVAALPGVAVILAGGLTAANVAIACEQVQPYGVDVMSGVASTQRSRKDAVKLAEFVSAVRSIGSSQPAT